MARRQVVRLALVMAGVILCVAGMAAQRISTLATGSLLAVAGTWAVGAGVAIVGLALVMFLVEHQMYRGLRYFWFHWRTLSRLEKQMLDAGFGIQRGWYVELPRVRLFFERGYSAGRLTVRNTLKFDNRLENVVMSSALGRYVAERHYVTDDGNEHVYELVDGSASFKLVFGSFGDFLARNATVGPYRLFLDGRSEVGLQHCLLVGLTGSGKTYALYCLVLQMLNKPVRYELSFADPKGSSLAVVGSVVAGDEGTAVGVSAIVELLEQFVATMRARKAELKERLETRIDADYSDFGMTPHVFVCDEYASLVAVLASGDKATRDRVKALLYEVILQGRQLGFFLFLVMQKSDATLIDTALRDNMPLKIVLGNSEQQTYVTAFGAGVAIPTRHYVVGEGVFTEPVLAPEPKLVQFPQLKFDILQAFKAPVV